jgi:hypothetical protein
MIERVAACLYHYATGKDGWDMPSDQRDRWYGAARAAIAAMRDCTPEMLDAGSAAHPAGGYRRETLLNDIIECEWVAMVDAALECSTKPDDQ